MCIEYNINHYNAQSKYGVNAIRSKINEETIKTW